MAGREQRIASVQYQVNLAEPAALLRIAASRIDGAMMAADDPIQPLTQGGDRHPTIAVSVPISPVGKSYRPQHQRDQMATASLLYGHSADPPRSLIAPHAES